VVKWEERKEVDRQGGGRISEISRNKRMSQEERNPFATRLRETATKGAVWLVSGKKRKEKKRESRQKRGTTQEVRGVIMLAVHQRKNIGKGENLARIHCRGGEGLFY